MLPHPAEATLTGLAAHYEFALFDDSRLADERWHYRIGLRRGTAVVHGAGIGDKVPTPGSPSVLGLFRQPHPAAEIEVRGSMLEHEVDAADVLETSLEATSQRIVSLRRLPTPAGAAGDMLATWKTGGQSFVARHFAVRTGPRLFVVSCRAHAEHWESAAEGSLLSLRAFAPRGDGSLFAESVHAVRCVLPVPWSVAIPASWSVEMEPPAAHVASLQALQSAASPAPHPDELFGKLSLAVVRRAAAETAEELARAYLSALRDRAILPETWEFVPESAPLGFRHAFRLATAASRLGAPGEVQSRILASDEAWVLAGVVGPRRADGPDAWMRNKRALDLAMSTLELGSAR